MRISYKYLVVICWLAAIVWPVNAAATKYKWKRGQIALALSSSVISNRTNLASDAEALVAVERSLSTWQRAADVRFSLVSTNDQSVSPSGTRGDGVSLITIAATPENLAMFPKGLEDAAARTRVFPNVHGYITEADIVLNPYLQFSTNGTHGTFDLESTVTHEIGHLLGLGHSPVLSATMSENYGRNGAYGLPAFGWRTLAADDVAAVRSLYGQAGDQDECCGRIYGRLTGAKNASLAGLTVWAEDADNGRVLSATATTADGAFRFGGISAGKVRLWCQDDRDGRSSFAFELGEFPVTVGNSISITERVALEAADIGPQYIGFNGQLASLAVPVNTGLAYNILIGHNTDETRPSGLWFASTGITASQLPGSMKFAENLEAYGFEVAFDAEVEPGEYSIFVESATGQRRAFIGGLSVENFRNYWSAGTVNSVLK